MRRLLIIGVSALALAGAGAAGAQGGPHWVDDLLERVGLVEQANADQDVRIDSLEARIAELEYRLGRKCRKVTPTLMRCQVPAGYHIGR